MAPLLALLATFPARVALVFVLLALPWPGLGPLYGSLASEVTSAAIARPGPPVRLSCSAAPTPGSPWDLRVRAEENATGRFIETAVDLRRTGYLQSALFLALSLASPLRRSKKVAVVAIGLPTLQSLPLLPILAFFSGRLPIVAFPLAPPVRWAIEMLYRTLVAPLGMAYAVPALLWLGLVWVLEPTVLYGAT